MLLAFVCGCGGDGADDGGAGAGGNAGSGAGASSPSGGTASGGQTGAGGVAGTGSTTGGSSSLGGGAGAPTGGGSAAGASGGGTGGAGAGGAGGGNAAGMGGANGGMGAGGTSAGGMSAGGTGGSGNMGGGGGGSGCGVQPVTANAIPAVRNVLCYLYSVKGKSTLSGVQDCSWSAQDDIGYVQQNTGVYPAIIGGDFLYNDAVGTATAAWNAGSIPMIRFHMGRPEDADSYESSMATTDLADTLKVGSSRYNGLIKKLDHAVSELLRLQAAGVVVLWAPFHEAQPNGWFWWSKGSGEQYRQLWKLMFDYFAQKGVKNTIWLMPFSGSPSSSFYPGSAMVDFAGPDTYGNSQPFASNYRAAVTAIGNTVMPIALHETGYVPNPQDMFNNNQAPFVLFSVWCNDWIQDKNKNSVEELRTAYTHERTLNRGELPKF